MKSNGMVHVLVTEDVFSVTARRNMAEKSVVRLTDRPAMTIAVDLGRKATKPTKKKQHG